MDLILPDGDGLHLLRLLKAKDPSLEVIIMTGHGSISKAVEATKQGAFYFVAKPFDADEMLMLVGKALERRRLLAETSDLRRKLAEQAAYGRDARVLAGHQARLRDAGVGGRLRRQCAHRRARAAPARSWPPTRSTPRAPRVDGPMVKINCAALPKDLIESELFGHVKGAFTGATTDKSGLLEEAHRGSLLLDEITEMPVDLQAKLLRVLEERTVRRLGGAKIVPVDFRLICSTNREPGRGGERRAAPPGPLLPDQHGHRGAAARCASAPRTSRSWRSPSSIASGPSTGATVEGIDPEAYRRLLAYRWPGNVRELEHAIERAVLVARGREITLADLPEPLQHGDARARRLVAPQPPGLARGDRARVDPAGARDSTGWNKQAAAALLGLRRPTLYSKMRRHGIPQRRA